MLMFSSPFDSLNRDEDPQSPHSSQETGTEFYGIPKDFKEKLKYWVQILFKRKKIMRMTWVLRLDFFNV